MDILRNTPSPNLAQAARRRKKRSAPNSVPGSSLSGLNRNSIRVVELSRGTVGYGFTISGQKPCLLRCIVEGSPADRSYLRPGNCLVGVNGKDVSHLAHDEVVALIGRCTGLLRLHVADSYFSESSEEESIQVTQGRPKYHHRQRSTKSVISKNVPNSISKNQNEEVDDISYEKSLQGLEHGQISNRELMSDFTSLHHLAWDRLNSGPPRIPKIPMEMKEESPIPALPTRNRKSTNPNVETVSVFNNVMDRSSKSSKSDKSLVYPIPQEDNCSLFSKTSGSSSIGSSRTTTSKKFVCSGNSSPGSNSNISNSSLGVDYSLHTNGTLYQAVVGYVGSVELPVIEDKKRLQALSACVRRLRVERRMRSIVLLRVHSGGISLFSSTQNVQTGPPLAFYSSSIISYCGAYSDDRRFFGLVTCTNPNKHCSCHVFMVEPKLLNHIDHTRRARAFGIQCTVLEVPKSGQVLGLQECAEFPATADPILSSIVRLHRPVDDQQTHRSLSEASVRLESTNSSNSDSGIGFRDDCDRNSARIYDIVEPELLFDVKNIRQSPVLRRRYPHSPRKLSAMPYSSSSQSGCVDWEEDVEIGSNKSTNSLPTSAISLGFQADPQSLQEILGRENSESSGRRISRQPKKSSSNPLFPPSPPRHIEVSVVVAPTHQEKQSSIHEQQSSSSLGQAVNSGRVCGMTSPSLALSRNGTRSMDNLYSQEIFPCENFGSKENIGSTPVLNQEKETTNTKNNNNTDAFWEFKVPQPPKPKMEINRVETWAESIEKLIADPCGRQVFTEFLQHEYSAENIIFYNSCIRFKNAFENLTQSQRISMASTIFQRFLQNAASDPVNVDFQARNQVEKMLAQPSIEMFDLPLAQVFNLLKFDCYPRFLRSEMYRDYCSGATPLPQLLDETSDSDQDSVKSHKFDSDGRRKSLLPWHIKTRTKKSKSKDALNSDISFIQRAAMSESSDTEDGRRLSYKICRVILPDNSKTVLPCKPGETLCTVIQRLLEKREFNYSAFDAIAVSNGKSLDLTQEASELTEREIRVEARAFIGIELPHGWKVGIRANPTRKVSEVLKTILSTHSLKLDAVTVLDIDMEAQIDLKCPVGKVDGHNLLVRLKDSKLEEITNQVQEPCFDAGVEDDELSAKNQGSSVFRGFLRRSSKKYKRKGSKNSQQSETCDGSVSDKLSVQAENHPHGKSSPSINKDENCHPVQTAHRTQLPTNFVASPLTLASSELKLSENSRIRKPIYIAPNHDTNA